jgi:hypothetical protein
MLLEAVQLFSHIQHFIYVHMKNITHFFRRKLECQNKKHLDKTVQLNNTVTSNYLDDF